MPYSSRGPFSTTIPNPTFRRHSQPLASSPSPLALSATTSFPDPLFLSPGACGGGYNGCLHVPQSPERLPISVTMIARNAESLLPLSLGSVHDWVEEMVLVINDCKDRTAEVAQGYGAKVLERPWTNRRDQKNVVLKLATRPWILALDADEAVSPELREELRRWIAAAGPDDVGAEFPRQTWFLNRWITHGDWYPDYSLRLFRNGSAIWGGSAEHDKVVLQGSPARLHGALLHYSFPNINASVDKITAFADSFAREQQAAGRRWNLLETLFRPVWRFLRGYILRRGFLDGFPGFYIAVTTALYTFVRYSKLYEQEKKRDPQ